MFWLDLFLFVTGFIQIAYGITDGYKAISYQFPWHAFIQAHLPEGVKNCNGALISNRTILTAANCLEGAKTAIVGLGSTNRNTPLVSIRSTDIRLHQNYNRINYTNNLCIIQLPLELSLIKYNNIQSVQLPHHHSVNETYENLQGYLSGYGRTSINSNVSELLLYGIVRITPFRDCLNHFGREKISSNNFCSLGAFGSNQGACVSDWGAPLIVKEKLLNILVGMTTFISDKACGRDEPSAFTKILPHLDWIEKEMKTAYIVTY